MPLHHALHLSTGLPDEGSFNVAEKCQVSQSSTASSYAACAAPICCSVSMCCWSFKFFPQGVEDSEDLIDGQRGGPADYMSRPQLAVILW